MTMEGFSGFDKRQRVQRGTGSGASGLKYEMTKGKEIRDAEKKNFEEYVTNAVNEEKKRIEYIEDSTFRAVREQYIAEYEQGLRTGKSNWTNTMAALKDKGYYVGEDESKLTVWKPTGAAKTAFEYTVPGYDTNTRDPFLSGYEDSYEDYWREFNDEYNKVLRKELKNNYDGRSYDDLKEKEQKEVSQIASTAATQEAIDEVVMPILEKLQKKAKAGDGEAKRRAERIIDKLTGSVGGEITEKVTESNYFLFWALPGTEHTVYRKTYPYASQTQGPLAYIGTGTDRQYVYKEPSGQVKISKDYVKPTTEWQLLAGGTPIDYEFTHKQEQEKRKGELRELKRTNPLAYMFEEVKADIGLGGGTPTFGFEDIFYMVTKTPKEQEELELQKIIGSQERFAVSMKEKGIFGSALETYPGQLGMWYLTRGALTATSAAATGYFVGKGALRAAKGIDYGNLLFGAYFAGTSALEIKGLYETEGPEKAFAGALGMGVLFYGSGYGQRRIAARSYRVGLKRGFGKFETKFNVPGYKKAATQVMEAQYKIEEAKLRMPPKKELSLRKIQSLRQAPTWYLLFGKGLLSKGYVSVKGSSIADIYGLKIGRTAKDIDINLTGGLMYFPKRVMAVKTGLGIKAKLIALKLSDMMSDTHLGKTYSKYKGGGELSGILGFQTMKEIPVGIKGGGKTKIPRAEQWLGEKGSSIIRPAHAQRLKDVPDWFNIGKGIASYQVKTKQMSKLDFKKLIGEMKESKKFFSDKEVFKKIMMTPEESKMMYSTQELWKEKLFSHLIPKSVAEKKARSLILYGAQLETGRIGKVSSTKKIPKVGLSTSSILYPSHYPYYSSTSKSRSISSLYSSIKSSSISSSSKSKSSSSKSKSSSSKSASSKYYTPEPGIPEAKKKTPEQIEKEIAEGGFQKWMYPIIMPGAAEIFGKKFAKKLPGLQLEWGQL